MPKTTMDDRIQIITKNGPISRRGSIEATTGVSDTSAQLRHRPSVAGFAWQPVPANGVGRARPPSKHFSESIVVIISCLAWVAASSGAILINKHIMVDLKFSYPGAVAAVGMLGTIVACTLVCLVFKLVPLKAEITPLFYMTYIMPTGFFMAVTFQAGNLAYLYLSVSFVQMLKALTPVSTMLWGFLFKVESPTLPLISSVVLIAAGVMAASLGEVNFNLIGVVSMVSSVAAEGLRLVLMQYVLAKQQMQPLEALLYLAPACFMWLSLAVLIFESTAMRQKNAWELVVGYPLPFVFSGCVGFALNGLAMAVIKLASALALKVLGVCKDIGLVGFSIVAYGEKVSVVQIMGYCVSLVGFSWYNRIKARPRPVKGVGQ